MDWFRWWHGSLTDPKFRWVARKSGQRFTTVITLWVALLEHASTVTHGDADVTQGDNAVTRGDVSGFDCDSHDVLFDEDDGACRSIYCAMEAKGLIVDGRIARWGKRQPKREDSSAERTRGYRQRQKAQADGDANDNSVTDGDASVTQGDAPDKSRGEESKPIDASVVHKSERAPISSTPLPPSPAKARKTAIPADFGISDRVATWAVDKGHADLPQHLEHFIGKCKAKGYKYVDWDAAFMGAIREDWAGLSKGHDGQNGQKFDPTTFVNQHRRVA